MNKEKKFMMFGIILLLISLVGSLGTYAWFTWKSTNNPSITMNIGQLADVIFTSGNDISTSTLAPVYNYTDGEKTIFSINNRDTSGTSINYAVKLNITSIASELKSTDLKYVLLRNDTIVQEGDFSTISTGNTTIYSDSISSSGIINFVFYLYIDGNEENDLNMMNKSLSGTITVSEEQLTKYYMKGYDTSFDIIDYNNYECFQAGFTEDVIGCFEEVGPKFLSSNISAVQVSTINVVKPNEVPSEVGSATDISRDQDGSVLLYSKTSSDTGYSGENLYDLYIVTENGKIFLTNGANLFAYMVNLKSVDFANMYTDEVTDMSGMFAGCLKLQNIDVSSFNTSNVTNMSGMFYGWAVNGLLQMSSVSNIDVSSFDTSNVNDMSYMFCDTVNLTTIYASNKFVTINVINSNSMFNGCEKLVGSNGTKYNSSYIDKTYARIDTSSTPGYFTLKS